MRKIVCFGLCVAVATLLATGCEKDAKVVGRTFVIEPSRIRLGPDDAVAVLRAVGGEPPYTWSVSDENLGTVSSNSHVVTYTRTTAVGANTLRVTDGKSWQTEAVVYQHNDMP